MKVQLDKIGSVTVHAELPREVELSDWTEAKEGNVVVVKALQEKSVYDQIELVNGRMAKMSKDDVIAGALGRRRALHGFVGDLPDTLKVGDKVHVLNLGGVIGVCISGSPVVGKPLLCEVMGSIVRDEKIVSISRDLPPPPAALPDVPLILVEGTCMSSGKTAAAATICGKLNQRGCHGGGEHGDSAEGK